MSNYVMLAADHGSRSLKVIGVVGNAGATGEVPEEFKGAVKALRWDRVNMSEDDLDHVVIKVFKKEDGNFHVETTREFPVTVMSVKFSIDTLQVVNEEEHCWVG